MFYFDRRQTRERHCAFVLHVNIAPHTYPGDMIRKSTAHDQLVSSHPHTGTLSTQKKPYIITTSCYWYTLQLGGNYIVRFILYRASIRYIVSTLSIPERQRGGGKRRSFILVGHGCSRPISTGGKMTREELWSLTQKIQEQFLERKEKRIEK